MAEIDIYLRNMEEIKRRTNLLLNLTSGQLTLGAEDFDYELVSLNLRKILELIAFSSLAANHDSYSAAHRKYEKHWRAKSILTEVQKINPQFYPRPVEVSAPDSNGVKHLEEVVGGVLTKEEFEALYDRCSDILHAWNPFDPRSRVVHFGYSVGQWVEHIQNLLRVHYVTLADGRGIWVVVMEDPRDGRAHGYPADPVAPDD